MVWMILSVLTLLAMLAVNGIANSLPIGGNTTGDISDSYPTLFTPAGFTFSIWGLIYLLLIVFVVMLFVSEDTLSTNKDSVLILFNLINLLNIGWLLSWHHNRILLSTIVMVVLLGTLLVLLRTLSKEDTLAFATFSIYAGWISVATVANIAIWLVKADIPMFVNQPVFWLVVILGVTLVVAGYMLVVEKNTYYAAVFLWAYLGIAARFL